MSEAVINAERTYALVGTASCGKTSLAEMLLYSSGAVSRLGKIEEGTTTLDFEPEEVAHKCSTQPGVATYNFNGARHFMLDLPGESNFLGTMPYLLSAVDGVIFVIDAVDGARPLSKKLWRDVRNAGLPAIVVINKIDRENANFEAAVASLNSVLGMRTVLMQLPVKPTGAISGFAEVFSGKAASLAEPLKVLRADSAGEFAEDITTAFELNIENIAESNEELLSVYLEEGALDPEAALAGIKAGALSGELIPVFVADSLHGLGGAEILQGVVDFFPSPLNRAEFIDTEGNGHAPSLDASPALFVFHTLFDPFSGHVHLARVLTGILPLDAHLKDANTGELERVSSPFFLLGKTHIPCKENILPGSIVALGKLKQAKVGHTLGGEKGAFALATPRLSPQLISYAIAAKEKSDEDKVFTAISKLLDEDAALKLQRDEVTGEIIISGMGPLHVEMSVEKATRRSKVEILLKTPRVPYREAPYGKIQVQGRHKKQTGGHGQFGDCWLEIEALPRGSGYLFEDAIVGGAIPRQYIPAVDRGVQESAALGFLAGYPMVDFKAKLYDGSYHNVDSSEMAFKMAGHIAFKKAMEGLKIKLLEPVVNLTVSIPDEFMGDVIGNLSSKRGRIIGSDSQGGITEVRASVPMSEVLNYAPGLRAITAGQGIFTMEFDHYEEAPQQVVDKVLSEK